VTEAPGMNAPDLGSLLKTFMDHSTAMIYVLDTELRYLYLNRIARDLGYQGRSLDQVVGRTGRDFFPSAEDGSSDLDALEANDRYVLRSGKPVQVYETLLGKILYSQKWPLFDDGGAVFAVAGVSFDITTVIKERVSGEGDDETLIVNMMDSTSRMISAMLRMQAMMNRS
jgi:PAS domain-containing protein